MDREQLDELLALADPAAATPADQAAEAARQARGAAEALGLPALALRAAAWRCSQLLRLGRHHELQREARALRPALAQDPDLREERLELLRVLAMAACETGSFDVALEAARELTALAAERDEAGPALKAAIALAACFERMGDSWQALRVLGDAVASHGDAAPSLPHLIAVNGLTAVAIGAFHRLNGCAPPAEPAEMLARARTSAERARTLLGRIPNSSYEIAVLGNLGEVLLHQGELSQAGSLLQRAHATARTQNQHAHRWRVEATLGHWLLATEQPGQALALVEATLAEMGPDAPAQTAQRAHHVAYLAQRSLGRYKRALEHFEQVERIDRRRTTAQLRALSELFVTRIEAQQALSQAELARQEAQAQRQRAAEALEAAERDPLTGLGNRRRLTRLFGEELPRHQRAMAPLAVALIDIDHFKPINDEFGHPTGDAVLTAVAQLLRENMRAGDVVARMGGEEFVAVLRETAPARALETCERLRERIARHVFPMLPAERRITVSIGVAHVPPYDSAALLRAADGALYEAKRGGRDRVRAAGGP